MQKNSSFKIKIHSKEDSKRNILKLLAILLPLTLGPLVIWASMPVYGSDSSFFTNFFDTIQCIFFDEDGKFNYPWFISIFIIFGLLAAKAKLGKKRPDYKIKTIEFTEENLILTDYGDVCTKISYNDIQKFLLKIYVREIGDNNYGIKSIEINMDKKDTNLCIKHYCDYYNIFPLLDFRSKFLHFSEEIHCTDTSSLAQNFVNELRSDIENYKNGKMKKIPTQKEIIKTILMVIFIVILIGFVGSCLLEFILHP